MASLKGRKDTPAFGGGEKRKSIKIETDSTPTTYYRKKKGKDYIYSMGRKKGRKERKVKKKGRASPL